MPSTTTLRVLIVEDDRTSRFVLRRMLESIGGIDVVEAEDGQKAWEIVSVAPLPDLVFLDLNMPKMNGLEFLRLVRREPMLGKIRICICSAVRDRGLVVQAASLRPDHYILKPYSRTAIQAQVHQALGAPNPIDNMDSPESVCARLHIDPATYQSKLGVLLEQVRTITTRLPTLLMQLDVNGALVALDQAKRSAHDLGARRIFRLAEGLSRSFEANGGLIERRVATKEETASNLQQWLNRSADSLMQTIGQLRDELQTIETVAANAGAAANAQKDEAGDFETQEQAELNLLIGTLCEVFQRGKLLSTSRNVRSRSLNVPIKAAILGEDAARTLGAVTRKISFSLTIMEKDTADAIEDCRKIADLVKLLSYPLEGTSRWIPDAAIRLLETESASRNAQGIMLLRQAIGDDLEEFLRQKEVLIRQNLDQLYQQMGGGAQASEKQVREILQDVSERLQPALKGQLTTQPVYSTLDLPNLAGEGSDDRWTSPLSLLLNAGLVIRNAVADRGFDRNFTFSTFDRHAYLQSMDVFGDVLTASEDRDRASQEVQQLESIGQSELSRQEKCRLIWGIIKGDSTFTTPLT